jgi:hypothetical protein
MAKQKKTLDDASLRAMASMATSSSDLSKLQENYGWNAEDSTEQASDQPASVVAPAAKEAPAEPAIPVAQELGGTLAEEPVETPTVAVEEPPVKSVKSTPDTAAKKMNKYSATFLEPISGFERPTKVAYISKRSHSFISLLQRYASLTGSKVSMQEIMEHIFRQHFADNKVEIESIRATLLQKEAELHE